MIKLQKLQLDEQRSAPSPCGFQVLHPPRGHSPTSLSAPCQITRCLANNRVCAFFPLLLAFLSTDRCPRSTLSCHSLLCLRVFSYSSQLCSSPPHQCAVTQLSRPLLLAAKILSDLWPFQGLHTSLCPAVSLLAGSSPGSGFADSGVSAGQNCGSRCPNPYYVGMSGCLFPHTLANTVCYQM